MLKPLSTNFACHEKYLNSATVGLPCKHTISRMQQELVNWSKGELNPKQYDAIVNQCRKLFARLVDADRREVAIANQASTSVGLLAASLPEGSKILAPEGDFTSLLFPLLVQQNRGIEVTLVPLENLVSSITSEYDWVACSIVQSSNGIVTNLNKLTQAAKVAGCKVLLDGTQAVGWLPIQREYWDILVCGAYKWLLSPRGTAFVAIKPELYDQVVAVNANWYAGESPWEAIYGSPLRLASSARQYDISPAWLNWIGTLPALELITSIGIENIHQHNIALANMFCERMGLAPANSAIVSLDGQINTSAFTDRGLIASVRDGALRLSFHLYNHEQDVADAVEALSQK